MFIAMCVIALGLLPIMLASMIETDKLNLGKVSTGVFDLKAFRGHFGQENSFIHAAELLAAIDRGDPSFDVEGRTDHVPEVTEGATTYADATQHAPHTTKITYKLDPPPSTRYVNLDSLHDTLVIAEMSDHHVVHCNWDVMSGSNAYIVGSSQGRWSRLPQVAATERGQGVLLARKVLSAHADDQRPGCTHLSTVSVHPWELFSFVSIVARGASPFTHTYYHGRDAPVNAQSSPPGSAASVPTATAQQTAQQARRHAQATAQNVSRACDDSNYGSCAQRAVNASTPKFMFNTADGKTATQPDRHLGVSITYNQTSGAESYRYHTSLEGVVCSSCFAYLGTGFEVTVEYSRSAGVSAELVNTGGSGFNIDLEFRNASLSGSYYFPALFPLDDERWVHMDVGKTAGLPPGALTLAHKFGGMMIEVAGHGRTTGITYLKSGLMDATVIASAASSGSDSSSGSGSSQPSLRRYFESDQLSSLSATVVLAATENFKVTLDLAHGTAASSPSEFLFDANVAGNVTCVSRPRAVAASVRIEPKKASTAVTAASAAAAGRAPYIPGDAVAIRYEYSGLAANETVALFYSVSVDGGAEYPVMKERFVASLRGEGSHLASWVVPWDMHLVGHSAVLLVRSSSDITRVLASAEFALRLFTEEDGIFASPVAEEIVQTGERYDLRWQAQLLQLHEPLFYGAQGGRTLRSKYCHFTVVAETAADDGTTTSVSIDLTPYLVNGTAGADLGNYGVATVVFPSHLASLGTRFYLWVHSASDFRVSGWSSGYFYLDARPDASRARASQLTPGTDRAGAAVAVASGKRAGSVFLADVGVGKRGAGQGTYAPRYTHLAHATPHAPLLDAGEGEGAAVASASIMMGGRRDSAAATGTDAHRESALLHRPYVTVHF